MNKTGSESYFQAGPEAARGWQAEHVDTLQPVVAAGGYLGIKGRIAFQEEKVAAYQPYTQAAEGFDFTGML